MRYTSYKMKSAEMNKTLLLILAFILGFVSGPASAAPQTQPRIEKGWFYFDDPIKKEEVAEDKAPPDATPIRELPKELPPPPKEQKCKKRETWVPECGFVNPGADFDFQAKQRDALMQRMSVANNDPKAVEDFQYYMRWVLERTSEVTNLWWYNMVQNPELDPTVKAPVSAFGLRLMTDVKNGKDNELFALVKQEGGAFVYFSRTDCEFCHHMKDTLMRVSRDTGVAVRNASLDSTCMPGFEEGCIAGEKAVSAAQALQVRTVPSLFLYVQPNTWLRVATGVSDVESIKARTSQFFAAYRNALLTNTENGFKGRASVNFGDTSPDGTAKGVAGSGDTMQAPREEDIKSLLNMSAGTSNYTK